MKIKQQVFWFLCLYLDFVSLRTGFIGLIGPENFTFKSSNHQQSQNPNEKPRNLQSNHTLPPRGRSRLHNLLNSRTQSLP